MGYYQWSGTVPSGTRLYTSRAGGRLTDLTQSIGVTWTHRELDGGNWWANFTIPASYPGYGGQSAWTPEGRIVGITQTYVETTGKASPPTSLSLSADIAESAVTLHFSGARGGTANAIRGYTIQSADSADNAGWSEWAAAQELDTTATEGSVVLASNPTRGHYRKFRMRTRGSAGASWYSGWSAESPAVRTNRLPVIASVEVDRKTCSMTPTLRVVVAAEPDGQGQKIYCNDVEMSAVSPSGGVARLRISAAVGVHQLTFRLVDALGAVATKAHEIEVAPPVFAREIAALDLISDESFKHTEEIQQLYTLVNRQRAFYKLPAIHVADDIGMFSGWKRQMEELMNGLDDCARSSGQAPKARPQLVRSYPKADVIRFIRQYLQEI